MKRYRAQRRREESHHEQGQTDRQGELDDGRRSGFGASGPPAGHLQLAAGLSMPWWGWALAGWTGLSFVLGLLIGRWLKAVRLTEEERAWLADSEADEQVRGQQDRAVGQRARS